MTRHLHGGGLATALLLAGCASGPPGPAPSPGQVAGLGAGAAAGAWLGDKVAGTTGAVIGAAAGLGGAAWLENRAAGDAANEAVEQARREERQRIMRQYWYDQTQAPRDPGGAEPPDRPLLHYPAGAYDGLNFGARLAAGPSLTEPIR